MTELVNRLILDKRDKCTQPQDPPAHPAAFEGKISASQLINMRMWKAMPTEKPRFTIVVDAELLKKIDDFRFENRYPSRSAATVDLIRLGIERVERKKDAEN